MRLRKFRLRSMGPFEDVTVDLDSLPGPLVALVGRNGAGKTSALELAYAGAQYRETPTQGTLAERSTNKGSLVESWIGDIHIKHLVGDGKVLVQRGSAVLVPSGGVTPFDLWAEKSLPPKDLFHAGVFGAQGSSGFLGMTPGPRKGVVLRALGIERVEALSKMAGEKRDDAQLEVGRIDRQIGDERARIGAGADLGAALALRQQAVADAIAALTTAQDGSQEAQQALDEARRLASGRELALATARAHEERAEELRHRHRVLTEAIEAAELRRARIVEALAGADEHRRAAAELEEWRRRLADLEAEARLMAERKERRADLAARRGTAEEALQALERRRSEALRALEERDAVRALAARVDGLRTGRFDVEARGRDASAAMDQADRDRLAAGREKDSAGRVALEHRARAQRADEVLRDLPLVEEAEQRLPDLRADEETADAARSAAADEVDRIRKLLVDGKDQRIAGLRDGLASIFEVDNTQAAHGVARGALDEDDETASEHGAAPEALRAAERVLEEKGRLFREASRKVGEAERRAERRPEMERAIQERDGALAAAEHADAEVLKQEWIAEQATETRDALRHEVAILRRGYIHRAKRLAAAEKAAERLPEIARAEATILVLEEPIAAARATIAAADRELQDLDGAPILWGPPESLTEAREAVHRAQTSATKLVGIAAAEAELRALDEQSDRDAAAIADVAAKLAQLGPAPEVPVAVDLELAAREVDYKLRRVREAVVAHAHAETALAGAREVATRIAVLEPQLHAAEQLVADWALIAKTLGRDGLQALLIDAAGPELTALVNDLLRSCFGSRYTVKIETTRAKKDGKGDKEVCDVLVHDAQHPELGWREGRRFSGGEKAILGEAIALALTAVSCRRAGLTDVTLVRDETAGLDETFGGNITAYVTMLRRAAAIIGASKVLFVLHNAPSAWALADAVLLVDQGRIVQAQVVDGRVVPLEAEEAVFEEREAA